VSNRRRLLLFMAFVAGVLLIDQAGKFLATEYLVDGLRRSYLADILRLEYMKNTGAILGLGSKLPDEIRRWLMPSTTIVILIAVSGMLIREAKSGWGTAGLSLVWAGGFANLVDRIAYGEVVDFFNLGIGAVRTGTSNLADVAIMIGIPMILIGWRPSKEPTPSIDEQKPVVDLEKPT
jgi:signal peptidase II